MIHGVEIVDQVDENGHLLEKRTLRECMEKGYLHRAVSIFVFNSKGELYLQRRSRKDEWLPGLWTTSCTGHVKSGEECAQAAYRELKEELRLQPIKLIFLFQLQLPPIKSRGLVEYELLHVFEANSGERAISPDTREVEEGRFFGIPAAKAFFRKNAKKITRDAQYAFKEYCRVKGI